MKRILIFLMLIFWVCLIQAQVSNVAEYRIVNATTAFGRNIPIGTKVFDVDQEQYYVAIAAVASTSTLTTASASFFEIAGGSGVTNLTFSGATSPVTLQSSTGTDVTFTAGTNVTLAGTSTNLTINATGGGTPGGSTGDIQYNNAGAFGGFGDWDGTTMTVGGDVETDRIIIVHAAAQSTSGTINIDTRSNASSDLITLTGNSTLNLNYLEVGQFGSVLVRQDATGTRTLGIFTYSDDATTGYTELYSGGLELINSGASTFCEIEYKAYTTYTRINVIWLEE
jgi:hypothetical protein